VTQFAAGCAICGEDLVAARRKREERYEALPALRLRSPSWFPQITTQEAVLGALLIIIAFFVPVVGVLIAAVIAFFAHLNDEIVQRNLALVAVAVGVIVLMLIQFVPATWDELLPWVDLSGPLPN
jgi:uncharacterized YccA/Bax inhibitor family protein